MALLLRHPMTLSLPLLAALAWLLLARQPAEPAGKVRKTTVIGSVYEVDPRFEKAINANVARARQEIRKQRDAGRFVAYLSTPISPRGGGHEPTNLAISAAVRKRLEAAAGGKLWVLDPGEFQMAKLEGQEPSGSDFLYMWTEILAGTDGKATDFDLVYFIGPSDVRAYFGAPEPGGLLTAVERYVEAEAARNEKFRREVAEVAARRRDFLRFYAFRASVAYSKGAHDEWNLFVRVNKKRGVGEQVAMFFDGRALSPGEMETEILPGYELVK